MTVSTVKKAKEILSQIDALRDTIYSLKVRIEYEPKAGQTTKKWIMRLKNFIDCKSGKEEPEQAKIIIFNGISPYGVYIPVDEDLINYLKEFFVKKLEEKQREFDEL